MKDRDQTNQQKKHTQNRQTMEEEEYITNDIVIICPKKIYGIHKGQEV